MKLVTPSSPHIHGDTSIRMMMTRVLLALVPAIITYIYFFGWGLLVNIVLTTCTAYACEAAMLKVRNRPIEPFIKDLSVLVTAVLLAFCLPSLTPWWIPVIGAIFSVVVAKHLYGGLGYNPFNPAMVGYIVLLISFPLEMTAWIPPNVAHELNIGLSATIIASFTGYLPFDLTLDAITSATPLDSVKTQLGLSKTVGEVTQSSLLFGDFGGIGWEWVGNWLFLGGIWLIYKKVISWHIPLAVLSSLFTISFIFFLIDADYYTSPMFHLFSGASMLGAFFIATDPVTACTTVRGRLYYGAGIGLLTYIIRVWGGYPDGIGFAVLLMNMAAPSIDYYTQPRVYGHEKND